MKIECTFGRLKGRFRRFEVASKNGHNEIFINSFMFACILHNMIKKFKLENESDQLENEDITDV